MKGNINVYAVVVTYNGMIWYDNCFSSLIASSIPLNIIVVDNASSDGTSSYIQSHFSKIKYIQSNENLGFGKANNIGIKYALEQNADYIFLLNQDAWVEKNTLEVLIEVALDNPKYGILSPIHLNGDKTEIEQGMLVPLALPIHTPPEIISDFYLGIKKDIYDTNYVLAAAWLLPRKTIETVGGFDPIFYHYGEDDNYLSRVIYHGLKIGIVPRVTICHDTKIKVKKTKQQQNNFDKWLLQRSTDLLYSDNHIDDMIKEYTKTAVQKLLTFHKRTFIENYKNVEFLKKNKDKILYSREMNKQKGKTWL